MLIGVEVRLSAIKLVGRKKKIIHPKYSIKNGVVNMNSMKAAAIIFFKISAYRRVSSLHALLVNLIIFFKGNCQMCIQNPRENNS